MKNFPQDIYEKENNSQNDELENLLINHTAFITVRLLRIISIISSF